MNDLYRVVDSYMREAVALPENLLADNSINWDFVDADVHIRLNPVNETVNKYYEYFNLIADDILSESGSYII